MPRRQSGQKQGPIIPSHCFTFNVLVRHENDPCFSPCKKCECDVIMAFINTNIQWKTIHSTKKTVSTFPN